jgi:threonine aldolase
MKLIDLRSDVKTLPTPGMLRAISAARLGDEQEGEDPTVRELEAQLADLLGHEAAIFVPSATMANLIALLCQVRPGEEVLGHEHGHLFRYEAGGGSALAGAVLTGLPGEHGWFPGSLVRDHAQLTDSTHRPRTSLVVAENTHNTAGGRVWPLTHLHELYRSCNELGLPVHVDGSRLFNAAVALGVPAKRLVAEARTVTVCFSKGLGCPAGAALVGPAEMLARCGRIKQMLGGAMRQAGILAAAAVYSLQHNTARLSEDHGTAQILASRLHNAGLPVDLAQVETNIILLDLAGLGIERAVALARLAEAGVPLSNGHKPTVIRAVTHMGVSAAVIDDAANRIIRALQPESIRAAPQLS